MYANPFTQLFCLKFRDKPVKQGPSRVIGYIWKEIRLTFNITELEEKGLCLITF